MFLNVSFLNLRYFFITCRHINNSNNLNYILFITYREIRNNQREHDYFAFKTSLAFSKFMKVNLECTLKYFRLTTLNDETMLLSTLSSSKLLKTKYIEINIIRIN